MVTTAAPVAELVEDIDNTGPSCASMQEPAAAVGSGASGSGTSSEKPNRSASFLLGKRRRTTGGPLLLGGAVRVRQSQQQQSEEKDEQGEVDEADGMQAIIKVCCCSCSFHFLRMCGISFIITLLATTTLDPRP